MLTVADKGEGGVKNQGKSADVLYGWSLWILTASIQSYRSWQNVKTVYESVPDTNGQNASLCIL